MSISSNPTLKDPERAFALQKYLLLHSQHDALQKHLEQISPSSPSAPSQSPARYSRHSSTSSQSTSPSFSPSSPPHLPQNQSYNHAHQRSLSVAPQSRPALVTRRSSLPAIRDELEHAREEVELDEMRLKMVNQQIKSTLTELLNCESVRGDRRYRMWVQTRLMDAERELKRERRVSLGVEGL